MTRQIAAEAKDSARTYLAFTVGQFWLGLFAALVFLVGAAYGYLQVTVPPIAIKAVDPTVARLEQADRETRQLVETANAAQDRTINERLNLLLDEIRYIRGQVDQLRNQSGGGRDRNAGR